MATLAFVLFFVLSGLGVLFVALGGGRGEDRPQPESRTRGRRRLALTAFALGILGLGVGVPAAVIGAAGNRTGIPAANVASLTPAEKEGRALFARSCRNCHTLAAGNAVATVGPDLDKLRPPKALVLDAIRNGRARGNGMMAGDLVTGRDAEDVAAFVAKAVGKSAAK